MKSLPAFSIILLHAHSFAQPHLPQVRANRKDNQQYVWIPPGTFQMGCSLGDNECLEGERPLHEVTITKGFWLGQTTVTMRTWRRYRSSTGATPLPVMDDHGHKLDDLHSDDDMPVNGLTWIEAARLCEWAGGRLPTEAEWEYAARAGTTGARYGDLEAIAWYGSNSGKNRIDSQKLWEADRIKYGGILLENQNNPHTVRSKQANAWGLYDMLGNVWQWTGDWYDSNYYAAGTSADPMGPSNGKQKVLRGGSWGEAPQTVRVSIRGADEPEGRSSTFGVRCVLR